MVPPLPITLGCTGRNQVQGAGPLQPHQGCCLIGWCGKGPVWEQEGRVLLPRGAEALI